MKIAFVIFCHENIGGAEKRLATLFFHLNKNDVRNKYILVVSSEVYDVLLKMQLINNNSEIIVYGNIKTKEKSEPVFKINNRLRKKIIPLFIKQFKGWIKDWIRLIKDSFFLNKIIKSHKIDLVYSTFLGSFALGFLCIFKKHIKHIVAYLDASFSNMNKSIWHIPNSYCVALKNAVAVDYLGKSYYEGVNKKIVLKSKSYIAPCSFIDYEKCIVKEKKNIVIFASRLVPFKNPLLFLEVARKVIERRKDIYFKIFGKGILEKECLNIINTYKLSSNVSMGYSYNLVEELAYSKIFVSLQQDENYPSQSIIEAIACGNTVIATNVGETDKLVKREFGYLVNFNAEEIAEKICFLIDKNDILLLNALKGNQYVRKIFSIENYATYLTNIFKDI